MKRTMMALAALALAGSLVLEAGQGSKGAGSGASKIDLGSVRTVTGAVTGVSIAKGMKHPSFLLSVSASEVLSVELGPYWFLVSNDFALAVGDQVSAKVANCAGRSSSDVVALSITDLTSGAAITLRDDAGMPLWKGARRGGQGRGGSSGGSGQGGQGGSGQGGRGGSCYASASQIDLSTLTTVEGEVAAVSVGLGTHRNTVTLRTGDGAEYVVALGPFWYMNQQGFSLEQGETVRVRMAQCTEGWAAFSVEIPASGATLTLRNEQGVPLWNA
jgi:hypothetical protein